MKTTVVNIFGAPGSGKSTTSALVNEKDLNSGDIYIGETSTILKIAEVLEKRNGFNIRR